MHHTPAANVTTWPNTLKTKLVITRYSQRLHCTAGQHHADCHTTLSIKTWRGLNLFRCYLSLFTLFMCVLVKVKTLL